MDDLLTYLFDERSNLLTAPVAAWLASSRRFTAFVTAHDNKIRKKLRTAQDTESLRDLQLELETAYLLLRERSLSVAYEPQHPELGRSPDFAVTYTTSLTFMVEVTRLRVVREGISTQIQALGTPSPENSLASSLVSEHLVGAVCGKLGQLLPQRSNVLIVGMDSTPVAQNDLHAVMLRLQQRAESNDSTVIQRNGFRDRAGFFHHFQRLSTLLVRGTSLQAGVPVVVWDNPQAKAPMPARVRRALSRSHTL